MYVTEMKSVKENIDTEDKLIFVS